MKKDLLIRPSRPEDIDGITTLFARSLGSETGVPTAEFWKWKHHDNPFGESPVLLALDGDRIVGLRAFMRWRWSLNGQNYSAYRAVDTATDPDYRGQGIFKTLTTSLLDKVSTNDYDSFIFNTPNNMSRPGYIKMGWEVLGKPELYFMFIPPFLKAALLKSPTDLDIERVVGKHSKADDKIRTRPNAQYVLWRYRAIPGKKYHLCYFENDNSEVIVAYEIRQKRWTECRICDIFYHGPKAQHLIKKALLSIASRHMPLVFAIMPTPSLQKLLSFPLTNFKARRFAPLMTLRKTGSTEIYNTVHDIGRWNPSIGALSLF